MTTILMDYENSKTSFLRILVLNVTDKMDLKRGDAGVALLNISIYYT